MDPGKRSDYIRWIWLKSSVQRLRRLMSNLESKKGKALFLLSLDLKGTYERVDNILLYSKLKASVHLHEWRSYIFHLLCSGTFKVLNPSGISSTWTPLWIVVPQRLHSAQNFFNLYINATVKELSCTSSEAYSYADTLGLQSRIK